MNLSTIIFLLFALLRAVKGDDHYLTDYIQHFDDKEKTYDNFVTNYVQSLNITDWLNVLVLEAPKKDPIMAEVKYYITKLIGKEPPDDGEYSTDGVYHGLSQAYRIRFIADKKWNMLNYFARTLDEYEDKVYDTMRGIYKTLTFSTAICDYLRRKKFERWNTTKNASNPLSFIEQLKAASQLDEKITKDCLNHPGASQLTFSKDLTATTLELYRDALALVCLTMDLSVNFDKDWGVNGRRPNEKIHAAHFRRMLDEAKESEVEIKANMDKWFSLWFNEQDPEKRKKSKSKYLEIKSRLNYTGVYTEANEDEYYDLGLYIEILQRNARDLNFYNYFKKVDCSCRQGIYKNIRRFKHDFPIVRNLTKQIINGLWGEMQVKFKPAEDKKSKGEWKFDIKRSGYQKIRKAWQTLDEYNELIKCELHKSYWLDLRKHVLEKSQVKLEHATLFTYFSKTLYQPCKTNDTDLVGGCTFLNHEICRPVIPSEAHQIHIDESGDNSYLRPKYVAKRVKSEDGEETCSTEETYIMPYKICRCGFLTGCKSKLHHEKNPMVCALIPNDNIRKQCRGNLGYPCYSQPLAPKMYDESCATGYCNQLKDACAPDPYKKFPKVEG